MSDKSPGHDPGKILDLEGLTGDPLDSGNISDEYNDINTNTTQKSLVGRASLGKTTDVGHATGQHPLGGDLMESEEDLRFTEAGLNPPSLATNLLSDLDSNLLAGEIFSTYKSRPFSRIL